MHKGDFLLKNRASCASYVTRSTCAVASGNLLLCRKTKAHMVRVLARNNGGTEQVREPEKEKERTHTTSISIL